jgi:hypothetical protein
MAEPEITEEDVEAAREAFDGWYEGDRDLDDVIRDQLLTIYRPGGPVARAIATELERLAGKPSIRLDDLAGDRVVYAVPAQALATTADEWREGER